MDSLGNAAPMPSTANSDVLLPGMVEHLRALGLEVPSRETDEIKAVNETLVRMPHLVFAGQILGSILLTPEYLVEKHVENGYGPDVRSEMFGSKRSMPTHYTVIGERKLILCENLIDSIIVAQALRYANTENPYTVGSAPIWGGRPKEWQRRGWWSRWNEILVVGEMDYARMIQRWIGRDIFRLPPIHLATPDNQVPSLGNLANWFAGGVTLPWDANTPETFDETQLFPEEDESQEPEPPIQSLEGFTPVDIHGAFFGGHLHYTVTVLKRDGPLECRDIRVVKSNRTLQEVVESPSAPNTEERDRVFRLDDGTHVERIPDNGGYGTWSWQSIQTYLNNGTARPTEELLSEIIMVLRSRVWLPDQTDYEILALAIMTSYVQEIFDAVPLILVVGPMGTGKSELSEMMAELGANGVLIPQSTMATISRTIDQCRGLSVLDDLENIGSSGGSAAFTELRQNLKLSYKKSTALRRVTEGTTGINLRFYGIKIINNTRGTDPILGSRMVQIKTAPMPAGTILPTASIDTKVLRDDLHTWAFCNVTTIASAYEAFAVPGNRSEEITIPLRVIAQLSTNPAHLRDLVAYFRAGKKLDLSEFDKELQDFLDSKLADGADVVVASQVRSELETLLNARGKAWPEDITDAKLGKRLRDLGYVARGVKAERDRVDGRNVQKNRLLNPRSIPLKVIPSPSPQVPPGSSDGEPIPQ